ncbi:5008_t:CDS:2, partial [Diversispora eburnea]
MTKRSFSQINTDNKTLTPLRRSKRDAAPPKRYSSPSPPPTKKRGRPLKRGAWAASKEFERRKSGRPSKRTRVMDTSASDNDFDHNLDFLFHPNSLIMLANVSFHAWQQMEVD